MSLQPTRKEHFQKIKANIGHTPLYEIKHIEIPNGNRIFAKEEYLNPTGSHYDRVFWNLLYSLEAQGIICPCQELVETTSGNAGASFAWLCAALGYQATIIMPEDMPKARLAHIKSFGANLIFSPRGQYIAGTIEYLRTYLQQRKLRGEAVYCPNHAEREDSIAGIEEGAREVIEDIKSLGIDKIDVHISALGGGITLRGFGNILKQQWHNMKVIGVEPFEAPEYYVRVFPGRFEATYGLEPTTNPHELLGIGRWGDSSYKFPHMEKMLECLDDIFLIKKSEWHSTSLKLRDIEAKHVGRTSAACLWAALEFAQEVSNKTFLLIFYDSAWKYLDLT